MSRRINISINQLALPFGESRARAISYEDKSRFFWFLASVSLLSLGVYVYAINAAAHHIAVRQNLEREVSEIATNLGSLEFAAIESKNAVTLDVAAERGFTEVREPLYVTRDTASSLTLNTVTR